jgi:hypothetical protein
MAERYGANTTVRRCFASGSSAPGATARNVHMVVIETEQR